MCASHNDCQLQHDARLSTGAEVPRTKQNLPPPPHLHSGNSTSIHCQNLVMCAQAGCLNQISRHRHNKVFSTLGEAIWTQTLACTVRHLCHVCLCVCVCVCVSVSVCLCLSLSLSFVSPFTAHSLPSNSCTCGCGGQVDHHRLEVACTWAQTTRCCKVAGVEAARTRSHQGLYPLVPASIP